MVFSGEMETIVIITKLRVRTLEPQHYNPFLTCLSSDKEASNGTFLPSSKSGAPVLKRVWIALRPLSVCLSVWHPSLAFVRISVCADFRTDFRLCGFLSVRISVCTDIRLCGFPSVRISVCTDFRLCGFPSVRISVCTDFRLCGFQFGIHPLLCSTRAPIPAAVHVDD